MDQTKFLYAIDNDPQFAWYMVAEWYLTDLFASFEEQNISIVLTMPPENAISHLARYFYIVQYREINYPEFDRDSTETQMRDWRQKVWPKIVDCMDSVSYRLGEEIKNRYDTQFANEFKSLVGKVDIEVIYGIIYKNINEAEESTESEGDSEYENESVY